MTSNTQSPVAFGVDTDDAETIWFFGELQRVLARGDQTGERFAVVEHQSPQRMSPPWHRQVRDDETFYVVEGEITFWGGNPKEPMHRAAPGSLVFIPRGTPHSFRVESPTARWLSIHGPAGHERFFRAGGEPAETRQLPPAGEPDIPKVMAIAPTHGVEFLGPPPGEAH